jgi:hypothetical protein
MKIGTLVGALVGGIVMFLLGFLVFGLLFTEYFKANTIQYSGLEKDPPVFWAIFLMNLVWAYLIAFVLEYAGRSGWGEGAKAGAILMFILGVGLNVEFYAFMNIHREVAPVIVSTGLLTVIGGITGAVVGLVMGMFGRKAAAA